MVDAKGSGNGSSHEYFSRHSCCMNIFPTTITGDTQPRGSNSLANNETVMRLVISSRGFTDTSNSNVSESGFHLIPRTLTASLGDSG